MMLQGQWVSVPDLELITVTWNFHGSAHFLQMIVGTAREGEKCLSNEAANCQIHMVWVVDKRNLSTELWWNDTGREKLLYFGKALSH